MPLPRYASPLAGHSPHPALEFQSTALTDYKLFAQALMRRRRWDMELRSRFLRYAQHTEASLLQHFYNRMQQSYSNLRTSIATSRRRVIAWRRQGPLLLDSYDTLVETCLRRREKFWVQSQVSPENPSFASLPLLSTVCSVQCAGAPARQMVVRLILCPCLEGARSREPAKPCVL